MADLLVDSDVFIDHLRGAQALRPRRHRIHYSAVTRCELFAGPADQEDVVAQLLSPFAEVDVDGMVAERAGRIRRGSGLLTPDALIAATALVHRLGLVTRNRRHFERVRGLRFADLG